MAGADERQQRAVLESVLSVLLDMRDFSTPPQIGDQVHRIVRRELGNGDPYGLAKEASTRHALELYPRMKALVAEARDPWDVALRLSIAGNIIDLGPGRDYDLWEVIQRVLHQPFAVDDRVALLEALRAAPWLLYLADNAGETVFDRVLIEILDLPVLYAVKEGPILNDATRADALAAGLDKVAEIVSTGSDAPGTTLSLCSEELRRLYDEAELVVAKGQANYETLSEAGSKVFVLMQVKCPVIAADAGVPVGSIMLRQG